MAFASSWHEACNRVSAKTFPRHSLRTMNLLFPPSDSLPGSIGPKLIHRSRFALPVSASSHYLPWRARPRS